MSNLQEVKRVGLVVLTKQPASRKVVTLAQKAVVGNAKPALQRGDGGYADWVIVSIHGLKTYLDLPYRRLLDVLYEMPRIGRFLDLEPSELPDFTTVCTRMQGSKMPIWRRLLRLSAGTIPIPADPGDRRNRDGSYRGEPALRQTDELHVQGGENDRLDRL